MRAIRARASPIKNRKRLKTLLDAGPTIIYTCKPSSDYPATFVSDNVTSRLGYEAREFLEDPKFWRKHIHPEDAPRVLAELSGLLERGFHVNEYRFLHKDGTYRWMYDELRLLLDETGHPVEVVG